jgi:cytochrome b
MTGGERVKVWDVGVRLFHWSLVALFFVAYFSGDDDSQLHVYAGYGVLALVAFRIVWGFVGTKHARFADFVRGRAATVGYARSMFARRPIHYLGHNPLGGWMVVALLVCLIGACWSGLEVYGAHGKGPLAREQSLVAPSALPQGDDASGARQQVTAAVRADRRFWHGVHEVLSNLTLALVFLHIAGALAASALHRENLVKSMITGYKLHRDS